MPKAIPSSDLQPSEGHIARQPAPQPPTQPAPVLPARGLPSARLPDATPARAGFGNVPTAGGQQSTKQPAATEVTTGTPTPTVPAGKQHRQG